jgi:hypothetical protein
MSFLLLLISTLQWSWRKAQNRFCLKGRWGEWVGQGQEGEITQTMYAHVNKLIIKKFKKHKTRKLTFREITYGAQFTWLINFSP